MKHSYLTDVDLPSDIYEYATSSYGLSGVDLNKIASYIEECTHNLATVEQQLAIELEVERPWPNLIHADLRLRKTTEIRRIRICRQIVVPIQQFPLDILVEIFLLCLPPMTEHRVRSLRSREAPLILCQVCSSWRTVAIDTPRLWNRLEFESPIVLGIPRDSIEKMKVWLGRGGDLPLSLRLTLGSNMIYPEPLLRDYVSLEELLLQEPLSFLANLDISIPFTDPFDLYPSFKRIGRLKHLESLILRSIRDRDNEVSDQGQLTLFPQSFNLRQAVRVNFFPEQISTTLFPWHQLTHLYAGNYLSTNTWYLLMRLCVNLKVGSFCTIQWSDGVRTGGEVVLLPYLSIFEIMVMHTEDGLKIPFSGLVLPALRTLQIYVAKNYTWLGLTDYSQLHLLQELALCGTDKPVTTEDLYNFFQATPLLSSLQLSIDTSYDVLFGDLFPTANPSLLPNLKKFEIHRTSWRTGPEEFVPGFIDMVKARWWIPSSSHSQATYNSRKFVRLRHAVLWFRGMGQAKTYLNIIQDSLQQCVDEGLILDLTDKAGDEDVMHIMPSYYGFGNWPEYLIDKLIN